MANLFNDLVTGFVVADIAALSIITVRLLLSIHTKRRLSCESSEPIVSPQQSPIEYYPFVSIHVPVNGQQGRAIIATLNSLAKTLYSNYEVIVVDYQSAGPAHWYSIDTHCRQLGPRFQFFQPPKVKTKSGALNYALRATRRDAHLVAVVEAGQEVEVEWLLNTLQHFDDPSIGIVQTRKTYKDFEGSWFATMANAEFEVDHALTADARQISGIGLMLPVIRKKALMQARGWAKSNNDSLSELAIRTKSHGYTSTFTESATGLAAIPITHAEYAEARRHWIYSEVETFKRHWNTVHTNSVSVQSLYFGARTLALMSTLVASLLMFAQGTSLHIPLALPIAWVALTIARAATQHAAAYKYEHRSPSQLLSATVIRLSLQHMSTIATLCALFGVNLKKATPATSVWKLTETRLALAFAAIGLLLAVTTHVAMSILGAAFLLQSLNYALVPALHLLSDYDVRRESIWSRRVERRIDSLVAPIHIHQEPTGVNELKAMQHARARFGLDLRHEPSAATRSSADFSHHYAIENPPIDVE